MGIISKIERAVGLKKAAKKRNAKRQRRTPLRKKNGEFRKRKS